MDEEPRMAQAPVVQEAPNQRVPTPPSRPLQERPRARYTVEDLNAKQFNKKKIHSIAVPQHNGKVQLKDYTFHPGKAQEMDQDIALLFLDVSPSFRVRNSRGQIVRPRKFDKGETRTVTLMPHQVAVSVTQVRKGVIFDMARAMPGGFARFPKDDGFYAREEIEEFIISGGTIEEDEDGNPLDTVVAA